MISEVDCNGDGIIDFCEFIKMMSRWELKVSDSTALHSEIYSCFAIQFKLQELHVPNFNTVKHRNTFHCNCRFSLRQDVYYNQQQTSSVDVTIFINLVVVVYLLKNKLLTLAFPLGTVTQTSTRISSSLTSLECSTGTTADISQR